MNIDGMGRQYPCLKSILRECRGLSVEEIAAREDIEIVMGPPCPGGHVKGILDGDVIVLPSGRGQQEYRETIAHELGHYFLHSGRLGGQCSITDSGELIMNEELRAIQEPRAEALGQVLLSLSK